MDNKVVIVSKKEIAYPDKTNLFFPSEAYPEYLFKNNLAIITNNVYELLRTAFFQFGFDKRNFNSKAWNPLGDVINPGQTVLIKPNMVLDGNQMQDNMDCLVTNPSLVKAVIDYVLIALKGTGKIIVGDAPVQSCNFSYLTDRVGYDSLIQYYNGKGYHNIFLQDFRDYTSAYVHGVLKETSKKSNGKIVQIDDESVFSNINPNELKRLRITNYPSNSLNKYHHGQQHSYCIAPALLEADVVINMPKPKTHRKAGVTGALKNMVGTVADKTCLPHHTVGSISEHGDEYQERSFFKALAAKSLDLRNDANKIFLKRFYGYRALLFSVFNHFVSGNNINEGSWYGNDTIWRTIYDLNKIVVNADKEGNIQQAHQRKMITIADMIVAGEKEGPLEPSAKYVGSIIVGTNPVCVDKVICSRMGFDWRKIPSIVKSQELFGNECQVFNGEKLTSLENLTKSSVNSIGKFRPSSGWRGFLDE